MYVKCSNYTEAQHYQIKYQGKLFSLQESDVTSNGKNLDSQVKEDIETLSYADLIAKYPDFDSEVKFAPGQTLYVLVLKKRKDW